MPLSRWSTCLALMLLLLITGAGPGLAATISAVDGGVKIDAGTTGTYTLSYPQLLGADQKVARKSIEKRPENDKATITYEGDAKVSVAIKPDGSIVYKFSNVPGDIKQLAFEMNINPSPVRDATWKLSDTATGPFPKEKPAKPHLYQGQSKALVITTADGKVLSITTPVSYSYNQLTDTREWGWPNFQWKVTWPYDPANPTFTIRVSDGAPAQVPAAAPAPAAAAAPAKPATPAASSASSSAAAKFDDKGLTIDRGTLGKFTLEYPQLLGSDQKVVKKIVSKQPADRSSVVQYEDGGQITLALEDSGALKLTFASIPQDVRQFSGGFFIPFNITDGGTWQTDSGTPTEFPREKPSKPHLFQGQARKLTIAKPDVTPLVIGLPENTYLQVTDNREWNWKIFKVSYNTPYNRDHKTEIMQLAGIPGLSGAAAVAPAVKPKPSIDMFGQDMKADYPQKVRSLDELRADVEAEKTYYASFNPPKFDRFGGLPDSGKKLGLKATGFFHVEKKNERWYLVNPDGNLYFHLGVCSFQPTDFTYVSGREEIYEWLPPRSGEFASAWNPQSTTDLSFHVVNQIRKYGKPTTIGDWTDRMVERVRKFGFNSAGAFTGTTLGEFARHNFPYVISLPVHTWHGFSYIPGVRETFDPYDQANRDRVEKKFSELVAARASDPLLIGYFMCNEPIYEDLPKVLPSLPGKWACKQALVKMLREQYQTIDAFNAAWNMSVTSFDELTDRGLPVTTPAAQKDIKAFTGQFLETLFSLLETTFRKYDQNHMILGARLQPGTANNEQLCTILGKYTDVFSLNYYTYYIDPEYIGRLYKWSGQKPMIYSEWYYNASSDSGLPGGVKDVKDQAERADGYRAYVETAAASGIVIGIEWYTNLDQPRTGMWYSKYQGENGNTGLFSVADRPWKELVEAAAKTNYDIYKVVLGERPAYVSVSPRFRPHAIASNSTKIARATTTLEIDGKSTGWPALPPELISSARVVQGSDSGGLEAAFRLCWDDQNLYVLVNVKDGTPMLNSNSPKSLWAGDAVELFIAPEEPERGGSLLPSDRQIILGAGQANGPTYVNHAAQQANVPIIVVPNVDGKGYTLEAAIPFTVLGFVPRDGQVIRFDMAIDDSTNGKDRARQIMWNGNERNSSDRSGWGRAVFLR